MAIFLRSRASSSAGEYTGKFPKWKCCLIAALLQKINRRGVLDQIRPLLEKRGELTGPLLTVTPEEGGGKKGKETTFLIRKELVGKVLTFKLHY